MWSFFQDDFSEDESPPIVPRKEFQPGILFRAFQLYVENDLIFGLNAPGLNSFKSSFGFCLFIFFLLIYISDKKITESKSTEAKTTFMGRINIKKVYIQCIVSPFQEICITCIYHICTMYMFNMHENSFCIILGFSLVKLLVFDSPRWILGQKKKYVSGYNSDEKVTRWCDFLFSFPTISLFSNIFWPI